ncbi:glycosyltransferase [Thioclava atlantica]|uniref:Glycosyl transferase family protein n=1 Tax=Thioclava atlantica TaxID=1317124 RepID=A0A085TXH8_9RHOB|nr:glycosyltransferase [Thioclava atlantica]KFE35425.1 glycosyl transferase family protein [Thioclava atlantica]
MMMDKTILIDLSTSYQFRHWKPMGILRVEHEVYRALADRFGARLCPVIYEEARDGFYRIPEALFEEVIFRNGRQPVVPERACTARSRWRSWMRVGRFVLRVCARGRGRAVRGEEARSRREAVIGTELLRLSVAEYAMMRRALVRLERVFPRIAASIQGLDALNHKAHFGLLRTVHDEICTPENRIEPDRVAHYVSAGGFWSDDRYRLAHRMRGAHGWRLHYYIHDLIPILWGHLAEPTTRTTYPAALHWMLWGVDRIWTNSETTRRDLLAHAARHGYPPLDPAQVLPVPLGADAARGRADPAMRQGIFARRNLVPGRFVLMVGTQEPRKNYDFVYRLWRELHHRHPGQVMPLVWVGQPGWSIAPLLEMLRNDAGLPHEAIRILPDVEDDELEELYRACRFSIYASHYEGWGLPVVEALGHGKPCLTSDAPALIEAGAGAAEPIGLFEGERWLERCHALMSDEAAYGAACARAARFEGRNWATFREELGADLEAAIGAARAAPVPESAQPSVQEDAA